MRLQLTGRIASGQKLLDGDLRDLAVVPGAEFGRDGTFLVAATGRHGGLSIYELNGGGRLAALADTARFNSPGRDPGALGVIDLNGAPQVVVGTGNALRRYRLDADGDLAAPVPLTLPGSAAGALAAAQLAGGKSAWYLADTATGALRGFAVGAAGTVKPLAVSPGSGTGAGGGTGPILPAGGAMLETATAGGAEFLLAAARTGAGVKAWRINDKTGALSLSDSLGADDGLGVFRPTALETVTAHGATWVLLAAAGSQSISVMKLRPDGQLQAADHLLDTLSTRFGGVQAMDVVKVNGRVFVIAGGADDGLSLFTLLPSGRLVHLQSLPHAAGRGLDNVAAIEAVRMGDAIQVFVGAAGGTGLSQFALPLDGLGRVLGGAGTVTGTKGGDLLMAAPGGRALLGGDGDDILVSGAEGSRLTGGDGRDIFVLKPSGGGRITITDFDPAEDRLDLSHFPMLRSPLQLRVKPTSTGLKIQFRDDKITVNSHDGKPLDADDIWGRELGTPDRALVLIPVPDRTLRGTAGRDHMAGGKGDDRLHGQAGNDRLSGGDGGDRLFGGQGADLLFGNRGNDRLWGGPGNDRARGGYGNDLLAGEKGNDTLFGEPGADRLRGGMGTDALHGQLGNDRLAGGDGNDRLFGGQGADLLFGNRGNDRAWGGPGNDRAWGGPGNDLLAGEKGNDTLFGEPGADELFGGAGDDRLWGGKHGDRLFGGAGRDMLHGQEGDDWLAGGAGNDTLTGGLGADRFVFRTGHGADRVTDFTPGIDRLQIDTGVTAFSDLALSARGGDTVIDTDGAAGTATVTLAGLLPAELSADDFLFV